MASERSMGDLQLIRFVRQHRYFYDTNSENYKNVRLKDNTWKKIAIALGLTVDVCKTRWKSLRTSYLRHCKLMACRKKEATKCRKWPLADELSFLNPYLVPTDGVVGPLSGIHWLCESDLATAAAAVCRRGKEELEPLAEDAWARIYDDAKPAAPPPLKPAPGSTPGTATAPNAASPPPAANPQSLKEEDEDDDEDEDEDDDIEEIIEHHPPDEEMREAFASGSPDGVGTPAVAVGSRSVSGADRLRARSDSAASEGSYSSLITLVEPDSAVSSRAHRGSTAGGVGTPDDDPRRLFPRDTTRDFFLYLADTVKTFPPHLQAQVKGKCFEAVNAAELSITIVNGRSSNLTPKR